MDVTGRLWKCLSIGVVAMSLLVGQTVFAQFTADELRGVNQIKNPGFEDEGPGGPGDSDLWTMNQERPWGTRVMGDAHSGDWSLEVDNTAPSDFGQWKEGKTFDTTEHIGGPMIDPSTGDELLPEDCNACYPIIPGESYTQSMWVKILEPTVPSTGEGDPGAGILMGFRVNFVGAAGQNGGSDSVLVPLDDKPIGEWFQVSNTNNYRKATMSSLTQGYSSFSHSWRGDT